MSKDKSLEVKKILTKHINPNDWLEEVLPEICQLFDQPSEQVEPKFNWQKSDKPVASPEILSKEEIKRIVNSHQIIEFGGKAVAKAQRDIDVAYYTAKLAQAKERVAKSLFSVLERTYQCYGEDGWEALKSRFGVK